MNRLRIFSNSAWDLRLKQGLAKDLPAVKSANLIWIHAVSVGELLVAVRLIELLNVIGKYEFLLTTTTFSGAKQAQNYLANNIVHCYMPFDIAPVVARFLRHFKPKMAIIVETELWPNWLDKLFAAEIPAVLANGRLSVKSLAKYRRFSWLFKPLLAKMSCFLLQSEAIANRFKLLGVGSAKIKVIPNLKYDKNTKVGVPKNYRSWQQQRPVVLAASTHPGEELMLLKALQQLSQEVKGAALIIVPRHPERAKAIGKLCQSMQLSFATSSRLEQEIVVTDVLLVDTFGQLASYYAAVDAAFIGGSLVRHGGHNPIEAIAQKCVCITGKHTFNFEEVYRGLLACQAFVQVDGVSELVSTFRDFWENESKLLNLQQNAEQYLHQIAGNSSCRYSEELKCLVEKSNLAS